MIYNTATPQSTDVRFYCGPFTSSIIGTSQGIGMPYYLPVRSKYLFWSILKKVQNMCDKPKRDYKTFNYLHSIASYQNETMGNH